MTENPPLGNNVNEASRPSKLRITDMRTVTIGPSTIIRLDTNQGLSGLGEVRDGASKTYALALKSRIPVSYTHLTLPTSDLV